MANCGQCGRPVSAFSAGELTDTCPECTARARMQQAQQQGINVEAAGPVVAGRHLTATHFIVGINSLIFVAMVVTNFLAHAKEPFFPSNQQLLRWGADFGPLTLDRQFWRLLTATFLHAGILHVGMNMWCLWDFGRIAERIYGRWQYVAIYLLTGIASSVTSLAWHPNVVGVGASGAVFGIVGAIIIPYRLGRVHMDPAVLKQRSKSLVMFTIYNLLFGFVVPGIDNAAHIGGLLGGIALAWCWFKLADVRPAPQPATALKLMVSAAMVLALAFAGVRDARAKQLLLQQAALALQAHDYDKAITKGQAYLRGHGDSADAHDIVGTAYAIKKDFPRAEEELKASVKAKPDDVYALYRLGLLYEEQRRFSDAEPVLSRAAELDPNDADIQQELGTASAAQGHTAQAINALRRSVQLDPNDADAQASLGALYSSTGNYADAANAFQRAATLNPSNKSYQEQLEHAIAAQKSGKTTATAR